MKNASLVTIGLMLVFFSMSVSLAIGGMNTNSNVTGNDTPLYFVITTVQNTTNPAIGANITYITSITISARAFEKFNLTNFSLNLPDNNTFNGNVSFVLNNETGLNSNETPDEFWIGQAAAQHNWLVFYGMTAFSNASAGSNGTRNATTWNLSWVAQAPISSTKIQASLTGRAYTETWNITNANSNVTVTNASIVVAPSWYYTRVGVPTTVSFNGTAFTTYSTNYTSLEAWTDLVLDGGTSNMIKLGSGYQTLSILYNGPAVSASSGNSPSSTASVTPTTTSQRVGLGLIIGVAALIAIAGGTALTLGLRKRRR